ncbi:hypothetical protein LEP1GSC188_2572 [Leptospira weilii serovar Topaz str. LT2116]|uniref:Uncharacterized protein n=1 Tax=Leptospira weilii serovar Topaz str. LT2116 TaxID=1088540 RepID=M3EGH8_9LEPT|nr:hypothetical protein LEP1GSC188_2572 [Leptospira weilii serovar Topaz str. LT2116]
MPECFTEDLSEFRQIYLRIQVFVDKVMELQSISCTSLFSFSP